MSSDELNTFGRTYLAKVKRLVAKGRLAELKYFLSTHPLTADEPCAVDELLIWAVEMADTELAIACLDIGANIDRDDDGFPPLLVCSG